MKPAGHVYLVVRKSHAFYLKPRLRDKVGRKNFGYGLWWLWWFFGGGY